MSRGMTKRVHKALADENLQAAFARLVPLVRAVSQMALEGIDFDALSQEIRRVKEESIENLPQLVERFKTEATRAGAVVYEAKDAADADNYVLKLAQEHKVKHIVKSKSMLTEEIGLREHLENAGIEVRETDIGEWIVQLGGERPTHMVGPALHKTIEQVADLLSEATGQKLEPDTQVLLDAARNALRQSYIDADMGISGANIAIAETGTLVILTNEANGVMASTLPPIRVGVVGYEKLVSSLEDATTILRLLSRSTMGMKLPIYVSYMTGPSHTEGIPGAPSLPGPGPSQVHIVLVDNGRTQMRDSDDFREALYCIKCGACLNICPVFRSVAGQTYGHIYQGGIGAVLTAFLHGMDEAKDVASLCLGCMACKEVCPARIDIPRMVTDLKAKQVADAGLTWKSRVAYRGVLKHPARLDRAIKGGSYVQQPFTDKDSMIRSLPYPLNSLTRTISLPALSRQSLGERLKDYSSPSAKGHPTVALYAGCIAAYAYPHLADDVMKVFRECGAGPYYPRGQACCGAPALFDGDVETALSLARRNIAALEEGTPDYIVTVCPGCATMLQQEYPRLTAAEPDWNQRARAISAKVRDSSQLVLELTPSAGKRDARGKKVTYHDPCYLKRGMGIYNEPRQLLQREGFELVEMADADACCGFGGKIVLDYPELSGSVLQRKLDTIEATGVDTVVTNCTPCVLQLRGGLDKRKSGIEVVHAVELMAKHSKATGEPARK